jgi:hypothetical protein
MPAALIIGVGKPGSKGGPPPPPKGMKPGGPKMPGMDPKPDPAAGSSPGGKASQKEALVISGDLADAMGGLSDDATCGNCSMLQGSTCSAVDGDFQPNDRCLRYFESNGGSQEPDADDAGGMPSMGAPQDQGEYGQ